MINAIAEIARVAKKNPDVVAKFLATRRFDLPIDPYALYETACLYYLMDYVGQSEPNDFDRIYRETYHEWAGYTIEQRALKRRQLEKNSSLSKKPPARRGKVKGKLLPFKKSQP